MLSLLSLLLEYLPDHLASVEFLKTQPTYMDEVCTDLYFLDDTLCSEWFQQATDHCFKKLFKTENQSNIWNLLQDMLFETASKALVHPTNMNMHPNQLTAFQCERLVRGIRNDYLLNTIPRQNLLIRQSKQLCSIFVCIFICLVAFQAFKLLVQACHFLKTKFNSTFGNSKVSEDRFSLRRKLEPILNARSLEAIKYETKYLRLKYEVQSHQLFAANGTPTLILKSKSMLQFVESTVYGQVDSIGRLHNLKKSLKEPNRKTLFTPTTTVNKVLKYVNQFNKGPLHILMVFDDEPEIIKPITGENGKTISKSEFSSPLSNRIKSRLTLKSSNSLTELKTSISGNNNAIENPLKATNSVYQSITKASSKTSLNSDTSKTSSKQMNEKPKERVTLSNPFLPPPTIQFKPTVSSKNVPKIHSKIRRAGTELSIFEKLPLSKAELPGCHNNRPPSKRNVLNFPISKMSLTHHRSKKGPNTVANSSKSQIPGEPAAVTGNIKVNPFLPQNLKKETF